MKLTSRRLIFSLALIGVGVGIFMITDKPTQAVFTDITGACAGVTEIPESECRALLAISNATDGDNWTNPWGDPLEGICDYVYYGIYCTDGHVSGIEMWENGMAGDIPAAIGDLPYLTFIDFMGNAITSLPAEIGNLTNLSDLMVSANSITSLPAEIGNLTNLRRLYLGLNLITSVPTWIGNLTGLWELTLNNNQLTSLPAEIGNLKILETLDLSYNQLTSLPVEIGNVTKLSSLTLNNNQLTSLPAEINNLRYLVNLRLSDNQLTYLPLNMGGMISLRYIDLSNNPFTAWPTGVNLITGLQTLTFQGNGSTITGGFTGIDNLINLTTLNMPYAGLSVLPAEICNLTNLTTLNLSFNALTTLPSAISNLTHLTTIALINNQLTSLPSSFGLLSSLTGTLTLSNNQLTSLPSTIGNLTNITSLVLNNNLIASLPTSIGNLIKLTSINLAMNKLTSLPSTIANLRALTSLRLDNNEISSLPDNIGAMTGLYDFRITNNNLTTLPNGFTGMVGLRGAGFSTARSPKFSGNCLNTGNILPAVVTFINTKLGSTAWQTQQRTGCAASTGSQDILAATGQYEALMALYTNNNGDHWTSTTGRSNSGTLCSRQGVVCDGSGYVEMLSIPSNGMTGTFATNGLTDLTHLISLNLSNNALTSIDTGIIQMTGLLAFNLSGNSLYLPSMDDGVKTYLDAQFGSSWRTQQIYPWGSCLGVTDIPVVECQALMALYNATNGSGWTRKANRGNNGAVCANWEGIYGEHCSGGHITTLELNMFNMSGSLPAEIGNLTELTRLQLGGGDTGTYLGAIPTEIANLHKLKVLVIQFAHVTSLPESMGTMTGLTQLNFYGNQITSLPDSLSNLVNLTGSQGFMLRENYLYTIPDAFINLPLGVLNRMNIQDNCIDGAGLSTGLYAILSGKLEFNGSSYQQHCAPIENEADIYGSLTAIYNATNGSGWTRQTNWLDTGVSFCTWQGVTCAAGQVGKLNLYDNNLSGSLPAEIGLLDRLTELNVNNNTGLFAVPSEIFSLPLLTALDLSYTSLTSLPSMPATTYLTSLDISYTPLSSLPANIGNLRKLTTLTMRNGNLYSLPESIGDLSALTDINIRQNYLTGLPSTIGNLTGLLHFDFSNNQITSLPASFAYLVNLTGYHSNQTYREDNCLSEIYMDTGVDALLDRIASPYDWAAVQTNCPDGYVYALTGQYEGLMAFYNATNGPGWTHNENRGNTGVSFCTREGISCRGGYVSYIDIWHDNMPGQIPAEIGNLIGLRKLSLNDCNLTGSIPAEIGNLTRLRTVYLQNNNLSGAVPAGIGNAPYLDQLILYNNNLTSLPAEIGNLANLRDLSVGSNRLTSLPTSIGQLSSLVYLGLSNNQLSAIPANVMQLTSLLTFDVSDNQLSTLPAGIENMHNLINLYLNNNLFTAIPTGVYNVPSLRALYMNNNNLGELSTSIGNLENLTVLALHNNYLTSLPNGFMGLSNLQANRTNINNNCISNGSLGASLFTFINNFLGTSRQSSQSNCPVCGNSSIEGAETCDDGAHNGELYYCSLTCNGPTLVTGASLLPSSDMDQRRSLTGRVQIEGARSTGMHFTNSGTLVVLNAGDANNKFELALSGLIITASSGTWDGTMVPPTLSTFVGTGIFFTGYEHRANLTYKVGATNVKLSFAGQLAEISFAVGDSYNTQTLRVYRSQDEGVNYSYLTSCVVAAGLCTFTTDSFSYFTLMSPIISSNGGGSANIAKDACPSGDMSPSFYDGTCAATITSKGSITNSPFSPELTEAYLYAFNFGITTQKTIQLANMEGKLLRSPMAKMMVNYALKVLKKTPDTSRACTFTDVANESSEIKGYITLACQLGLMGQGIDKFLPSQEVDRAQFGTILSRALGNSDESGPFYYSKHLEALKAKGIMTKIDNPERVKELRGYVMLMMMRASK